MLKAKAKAAVIWTALDIFLRQGMGFVISVILARLLTPEDFGTLALLSFFIGIAGIFVNFGFSSALIQRQDATHVDESTVFWFNVVAALFMALLLIAISPWVADFFTLPILKPLTMVMACNVFLGALGAIHNAILTKKLDFKTLMRINVTATFISGGIGIYMALSGYGVWSLAGQALTNTVIVTILLWFYNSWRPLLVFSNDSFKKLSAFSGWLFASWLMDTLYQRGYTLLIGKFYSPHDLGIYNRADSTQQLPSNALMDLLGRVAFPLYSSVNSDKERLRRGVRVSVRTIMLINTPLMMGLAVVAEPFVRVIFGAQWLPAAPILQILCGVGLLWPLQVINLNVLQAQGHGRLFFRLALIKKASGILLLIIGSYFGLMGIAWSRVIQSVIAFLINSHYTDKHINYGVRDQLRDCMPIAFNGLIMVAVVTMVYNMTASDGVLGLIVMVSAGAFIYLVSNVLLDTRAYKDTIAFIKGRL
jgi:teichuronic acid exporter